MKSAAKIGAAGGAVGEIRPSGAAQGGSRCVGSVLGASAGVERYQDTVWSNSYSGTGAGALGSKVGV